MMDGRSDQPAADDHTSLYFPGVRGQSAERPM
jgi:hypothetical protein